MRDMLCLANQINKDFEETHKIRLSLVSDKMLKQLDIETSNQGICQYFDDLLDDDRMLAEFAICISNIIGRSNFSVEQVRKFVQSEDLKG